MNARLHAWLPALTPHRRRQLWYGPLLAAAMALALLRLLVYARGLGVEDFGRLSAGLLVSSGFCMLGCLGLMPMLQREWPVRLVHGQRRRGWLRALQCATVALGLAIALVALSAGGVALVGLAGLTLALAVVHGFGQQLFLVVTTESRSAGDALRYARQQLARGVLLFGGGGLLVAGGAGVDALLAFEAAVTLAMALAIASRAARPALLAQLAPLAARGLAGVRWATAMTMMAVMLLSFAMTHVDRWLAAEWLEPAGFGLYAFAAIVLAVAQSAQALVNAAGYPLIARRHAAGGAAASFRVGLKLSLATLLAGALLLLPSAWAAQWGVAHGFPQYAGVAPLLPWLAAIGLVRAADFWTSFLVIAGHEALALRLNAASAAVALAAWGAWVVATPGAARSPASYVVLAGAVTVLGAVCTFAAAWRLGTMPNGADAVPPAAPRDIEAPAP